MDQIEAFERAGYKMSGYNKRQTEARAMRAERKVRTNQSIAEVSTNNCTNLC